MYATISLCLVLSSAALSAAAPYYVAAPQQRQFFYPVVPQYAQYPAVAPAVAPASLPYRQVYYPSQSTANLVAPVPSVLRYPASASPLVSPYPLPAKQAVYLPGPGGTYVLAEEGDDSGYFSFLYNYLSNYFTGEKPAESNEKPSEGESGSAAENTDQKGTPAKEGEKEKEGEEAKPDESAKIKGAHQNYVLVGQPQFFGNYGLQRVNPAAVIPSAENGAISSYLLLKNYPGVRFAPQVPQAQFPQAAADAELAPGSAALGYQKLLQASAARQQKEFDDDSSVTVDAESDVALKSADAETGKPAEAETEDKPEEEETGTAK